MYQVEDIRDFLRDPEAAGFNPQVVKDLLAHYDSQVELNKQLYSDQKKLEFQRDSFEKAAQEWMAMHDKLKSKYEPLIAEIPSSGAV